MNDPKQWAVCRRCRGIKPSGYKLQTRIATVCVLWVDALTEVAVGRNRHQLRVQEVLISNFIWAVIIHSHL